MITRKVKQGKIGVSHSTLFASEPLILIQAEDTDNEEQTRVVLTIEQARIFIKRVEDNIKIIDEKTKK